MHAASDGLDHEFATFLAQHPPRYPVLGGSVWEYIACGEGATPLLLLPGGFGVAATSFRYIQAFASHYRVIALSYPGDIDTVAGLVAGIIAILDAEGVEQAHVLGGSYSGLIAQCLVRQHAQRVATLILSHTGPPWPHRIRQSNWAIRLLAITPLPLLRALLRLASYGFLPERNAVQAFWRAHFAAIIAAQTRESCINRFRVAIDFDRNYRFSPTDLSGWPGHIAILEATHDNVVSAAERATLRALYPQAQVHTFRGGNHSATIDRPDEQIAVIRRVIEGS